MALKQAGASLVGSGGGGSSGGSGGDAGSKPPSSAPSLSMFQKLKIEVVMAKKYNGDVRRIPASNLNDMYKQDPRELMAKMNEDLGLRFESLEQTKKKHQKERRNRDLSPADAEAVAAAAEDDDPYKLRLIRRKLEAVCKDAETGEKLTIRDRPPEDVEMDGRHMDNLLWRQRLVEDVKEALDHPEYVNTAVLQRALDIYRADPKNAVPQPMSRPSKFERKGQVYAMLQALRQTHARQIYEMVLEEEERDKKRVQLMDWATSAAAGGDSGGGGGGDGDGDGDARRRVAKLVARFAAERQRWREFIALVQHDNQMKIAHVMTEYGLLR